MITRDAAFLAGEVSIPLLRGALEEHGQGARELDRLRDYYDGRHDVLQRRKTPGSSNNRLVVNHAKYIVDLAGAYLIGSPVRYAGPHGGQAIGPLLDAFRRCDIDSVDAELARHAGIYGKGVELLYIDGQARPRAAALDPRHAFVVYDDSVAHAPLFGVHRAPKTDQLGEQDGWVIAVYTARGCQRFWMKTRDGAVVLMGPPEPHFFGGVPVVEYWNNQDERGDFAPVMSLIDAYNLLMSDRVNDKEQLVEAVLMISGASLGDTDPEVNQTIRRLRDQRVLEMPASGASAAYLTKQMAEDQAQVLADAIARDIHKIAMVPALTDADFAGQASGVAMRYKLLGLEQLIKNKERWFREGLRSRLRLFAQVLALRGEAPIDPEAVAMTFSRGLPVNDLEQAQMVSLLKGMLPDEALLSQISFAEDALARGGKGLG